MDGMIDYYTYSQVSGYIQATYRAYSTYACPTGGLTWLDLVCGLSKFFDTTITTRAVHINCTLSIINVSFYSPFLLGQTSQHNKQILSSLPAVDHPPPGQVPEKNTHIPTSYMQDTLSGRSRKSPGQGMVSLVLSYSISEYLHLMGHRGRKHPWASITPDHLTAHPMTHDNKSIQLTTANKHRLSYPVTSRICMPHQRDATSRWGFTARTHLQYGSCHSRQLLNLYFNYRYLFAFKHPSHPSSTNH